MTIKEISEALNVSISTVSKALNDATDISEDTKQRIRQYAEDSGYRLKNKEGAHRILALYERVDSDTRNNILNHVITAFSDIAIANNYEVVIDYVANKSDDFVLNEYLKQNNFSAVFIVGMNFKSKVYKQLRSLSVPAVLLDNHISDAPLIGSVSSENISAVVSAVKYLTKRGHSRIGLVTGEKESLVSAERLAGYILGLARMGIDFNNKYVYYGDFTKESGEQAATFFSETDVSAVISCSDIMAMGLIDGLVSCGKRVPDDISVIGFDDLSLLKFTSYNLTTMKQKFDKLGQAAFMQIKDMLNGRQAQNVMINCKLIERGTVADVDK